jgi:hypothetical protein
MSLFPTSPRGWILSLARPLFIGCVVLLAMVVVGSLSGDIYWRYARSSISYQLLPALGFLLAASCIFAKGWPLRFRIVAGIVAAASVLYGFIAPILEPAF